MHTTMLTKARRTFVQRLRVFAIFLAQGVCIAALWAQAPAPAPSFEVASVKPNKSGTSFVNLGNLPGGRFNATNIAPMMLLLRAYQLQPSQIIGAPSWLNSERFDIVAKAPDNTPPAQMPLLIRALFADRFKLVAHNETRELQIYALVKVRADGKLGPQLRPAAIDCAAMLAARGRGGPPPGGPGGDFVGRGAAPGGPVPPPPDGRGGPPGAAFGPGNRPPCAQMIGPASINGGGITMTQLANQLATRVNRVVVDQTGLTGGFDLDLTWTPDQLPQGLPPTPPPGAPPLPAIDPNGPSIFTAVQEQLGLKLESTKGPAEVLVIDSIERPTED
jgi:uncharacterized protein (TIGR03435 family)